MEPKEKQWNRQQKRLILLGLALAVLTLAITGTLTWLSYVRKLQTATLVEKPDIVIEGPNGESMDFIQLGDIDLTSGTRLEYPFRIVTGMGSSYRLQLAYTTNLPLNYAIYPASKDESGNIAINGSLLTGTTWDKAKTLGKTYDPGDQVQADANPEYWQSDMVQQSGLHTYYVLVVTWSDELTNNKETDMIYMTVTDITG